MNTGAGDGLGGRNTSSSFLRVISLSIALYDNTNSLPNPHSYILTLPAEWRFYRSQPSWRLSLGCILFIAIRYSSIAVITLSNVGYFASFFTPQSCERYYIAAPIFKVLQTMVSQLILGIRTVNISRRSTVVTWFLASIFLTFTTAQWFLNMWNRVPVQGRRNNCTAGNTPPVLTVWLYYLLSMAYDILTLGISTAYLISFNPKSGKMAHLVRIMLTDGLVYFVALTGVNIFNLILYRGHDEATQSSGVSLGYALTWIMSQRILIHLRGSPRGPPLPSENATRSAFSADYDADADDDADVDDDDKWAGDEEKGEREEVSDLRVRIEETVTVEVAYDPAAHTRETYRAPRVLWAMRSGSAVGAGGGAGRSAQSSAARGTRGERGEREGDAGT
ncbi:hypothetical protein BN946_scf184921.g17 [Trametes cinnabarina]|uniref:Uncharacterized protein n=1 Tax=Pycnoporus cinnabarinus TaxID=5643 RepID=A0A060SNK4_PYCCI|nr:hypothetical protein BN946_scf184921.g17 [Trametes cinnabarina]